MLKVIAAIFLVVLINLRELINAKSRGKVMGIYFFLIGISLFLAVLLSLDKSPTSPTILLMNLVKALGLEKG